MTTLDDPPTITPADVTRARLRQMARVSFLANSARREKRRKRWAEAAHAVNVAAIVEAYLAGVSAVKLAKIHGVNRTAISKIIRENTSAQQRDERSRRMANYRSAVWDRKVGNIKAPIEVWKAKQAV